MFDSRLCKRFGDCITAAPGVVTPLNETLHINRSGIKDPELLRNTCLSKALTIAGEWKNTGALLHEVEKDMPFYLQSNGGVTLSGGEPLAREHDLTAFLKELRMRNIHVAIETSLHVEWNKIRRSLGYIGTYLIDLKHTDKKKFKEYTGGNLNLVLRNLNKLADAGEHIIIRIPVIPEFNHTQSEIHGIINYTVDLEMVREVHFIPYHTLGIEKYRMLGLNYEMGTHRPVDHSQLAGYVSYAHSKGLKTRIGG